MTKIPTLLPKNLVLQNSQKIYSYIITKNLVLQNSQKQTYSYNITKNNKFSYIITKKISSTKFPKNLLLHYYQKFNPTKFPKTNHSYIITKNNKFSYIITKKLSPTKFPKTNLLLHYYQKQQILLHYYQKNEPKNPTFLPKIAPNQPSNRKKRKANLHTSLREV